MNLVRKYYYLESLPVRCLPIYAFSFLLVDFTEETKNFMVLINKVYGHSQYSNNRAEKIN